MATKTMYATGTLKYGTRRLQAGDPIDMDAPTQRLYLALGKVTGEPPVGARAAEKTAEGTPKAPAKRDRKRKAKAKA
jgi:hypothetical protein